MMLPRMAPKVWWSIWAAGTVLIFSSLPFDHWVASVVWAMGIGLHLGILAYMFLEGLGLKKALRFNQERLEELEADLRERMGDYEFEKWKRGFEARLDWELEMRKQMEEK